MVTLMSLEDVPPTNNNVTGTLPDDSEALK